MSSQSTFFETIVGAYFEQLAAGDDIEPAVFIASQPEYKTRFLDFLRDETDIAGRLLSSSPRTWKEEPGKPFQSFGSMPATFGEYQIERCLGCGGMGTVFQARRSIDGPSVALKLLHPQQLLTAGLHVPAQLWSTQATAPKPSRQSLAPILRDTSVSVSDAAFPPLNTRPRLLREPDAR